MAGILDALKTFKQDRESIDDMAALPQTLIMQMAQKGQIPKTDVPMILNRKAEMAQNEANMNALRAQQTQGAAPSIIEQLMAVNARQEAPQEMTDVGIASNPVPEMRMAAGGIIAFEQGGDVGTFGGMGPDDMSMDQLRIDEAKFKKDMLQYEFLKDASPVAAERLLANNPALRSRVTPPASTPTRAPVSTSASRPATPTAPPTPAAPARQPVAAAPKEDDYMSTINQMMKDIQSERESLKGNRESNVNQSLLAAGLGMMAGTSPYAFANIGAGGMKGAEQFAALQGQDMKARQALLKESSDLAQTGGVLKQRALDSVQRGKEAQARLGMDKQRLDLEGGRVKANEDRIKMLGQGNRIKASQAFEQSQAPTLSAALKKQYGKNYMNVPEAQRVYSDAKNRYIREALGTMDSGALSADDL